MTCLYSNSREARGLAPAAGASAINRRAGTRRLSAAGIMMGAVPAVTLAFIPAANALTASSSTSSTCSTCSPLTTIVSTINPSQPTIIVSAVNPATSTSNTTVPSTIISSFNPATLSAISSVASSTMPTVLVSTFNPNMPNTFVSSVNPATTSYNPYAPYTIVTTINPGTPNRFVTTITPTTLDTIASAVNPLSPNTVTTTSNPSTGTFTTVITSNSGTARGSQVGTVTAQASIRVTRTFTETLSDRNEDAVKGDGTLVSPAVEALPASARSYAPTSSFQAYFPKDVLRPGPELFTPKYKIYGTGFGGGFSDTTSLQGSFAGGLIGLDAQVLPNLLVGGAAGGSTVHSNSSLLSSAGDASGFNGSLYAIATKDSYYAQSVTTFSAFNNETVRNVAVGGFAATEEALFGSFEARERVEIGRVLTAKDVPSLGDYRIVPFVAFEYANLRLNGHSETNLLGTGTSANLTLGGQTITDLPTFLGARFERTFDVGSGITMTPILRLAYVHQFANAPVSNSFAAATGATVFASNTTTLGRNAALTKAGVEIGLRRDLVVYGNFDGLFSGDTSLYGGRAGIRYAF